MCHNCPPSQTVAPLAILGTMTVPYVGETIVLPPQHGPCHCGAPSTMTEGDGYGPDREVCDAHSRFRSPAMPLPAGYHARTHGFPIAAPYGSGVWTAAALGGA